MDLINHIEEVVGATDMNNLLSDLPLAIFMVKLLAIKSGIIPKIDRFSRSRLESFHKNSHRALNL